MAIEGFAMERKSCRLQRLDGGAGRATRRLVKKPFPLPNSRSPRNRQQDGKRRSGTHATFDLDAAAMAIYNAPGDRQTQAVAAPLGIMARRIFLKGSTQRLHLFRGHPRPLVPD